MSFQEYINLKNTHSTQKKNVKHAKYIKTIIFFVYIDFANYFYCGKAFFHVPSFLCVKTNRLDFFSFVFFYFIVLCLCSSNYFTVNMFTFTVRIQQEIHKSVYLCILLGNDSMGFILPRCSGEVIRNRINAKIVRYCVHFWYGKHKTKVKCQNRFNDKLKNKKCV